MFYQHAGRLSRFRTNIALLRKWDAVDSWVQFESNTSQPTFWQRVSALKGLATVGISHNANHLFMGDGEALSLAYTKAQGWHDR